MKVAINGFGRIGRLVFKLLFEDSDFEIIAINDLGTLDEIAYLLKYDTNYGRYKLNEINFDENHLYVGNKKIFSEDTGASYRQARLHCYRNCYIYIIADDTCDPQHFLF